MAAMKKIVVVGSSNTDMIIKTSRLPRPGETVLGGKFFMAAGGKGANQAVAAARAGGDVVFVARVGDDLFGNRALEGFTKDGINVEYVFKDKKAASGVALILVGSGGENSIAVASGANTRLSSRDIDRAKKVITSADVLLLQLETPLETVVRAARIAHKAGVRVILNPAPARALPDSFFQHISVLTPNESEAEILTGRKIRSASDIEKAHEELLKRGVKTVIITLGKKGAFVAAPGVRRIIPAFKARAVDTTAAGDVFNGALAVALAERRLLLKAVHFAHAAAAISVTRLGAQPSAPWIAEIEDLLGRKTKKGTSVLRKVKAPGYA